MSHNISFATFIINNNVINMDVVKDPCECAISAFKAFMMYVHPLYDSTLYISIILNFSIFSRDFRYLLVRFKLGF